MANPQVVVDFVADTSDLVNGFRRAQREGSALGDNLKAVGKRAAIAGGAAGFTALAAGAAYAVKAGSDLNESINAVNVVFGKAAKTVLDFSQKAAKQAGLSMREFNQLVTPIGAALRNVGFGADEAAKQSIELTKRAADMASVFNTTVPDALEAIQAGLRGEADPLERFGVGLSDAAVQAEAQAQGMEKVNGQLTASQKAQARLAILYRQTNRLQGDFVNTSDQLANQQRIIHAQFENIAATIGIKLLPIISRAIAFLQEHWPEIAAVIEKAWKEQIEPTFVAFAELVDATVKFIHDNWATIGPIVKAVADIYEAQFKTMIAVMRLFAAILRGDWSAAWHALVDIMRGVLDQIVARLKLAAAIGGALVAAAKAIGRAILTGVVAGLEGIGAAAWGVIDNIAAVIAEKAQAVIGWGRSVGAWVKSGVTAGLDGIGAAAWSVLNNIGAVFQQFAQTIIGWGENVGGWIKRGVIKGFEGIGEVLAKAIKAPINAVIRLLNGLKIPGRKISVPGPLPDIHIPSIDLFPHIPELAKGGVITRPTLAMIGEAGPEAIVPLSSVAAPIEVRVFIGDQELRGMIRTEVRSQDSRTAQVLLSGMAL